MSYPAYPHPQGPTPLRKRRTWPWVLASLGGVVLLALTFLFGVMVGAAGDSLGEAQAPTAQGTQAPLATSSSPESGPDLSAAKTVELTDRGTLPMKVGASATASAGGEELATMTVHSIDVDPVCTGSYIRKPENGHFVVMDVSVEVASHSKLSAAGVSYPKVSMRQGGFHMVDKNGKKSQGNDIIGNGYGCLPEGEGLPVDIEAGENASGKIIFDVPSAEGAIILPELISGVDSGIQGWEWAFPNK